MSNGKTRIYELAKELHRDNKDVLAVCESLGIIVKSHSSTISDDEVDRIRTAAKSLPISSPAPMSSHRPAADSRRTTSTPPPIKQAKPQQILEIRRHQPAAEVTSLNRPTSEANPNSTTAPNRPARPAEPRPAPLPTQPTPQISQSSPQPAPAAKATLVQPPAKARVESSPVQIAEEHPASLLQKPLLRRVRTEEAQPERFAPTSADPVGRESAAPRSVPQLQPLQRPRPPQPADPNRPILEKPPTRTAPGDASSADGSDPTIEVLDLSGSRLLPSRSKRPKTKQEEEDLLQEELLNKPVNKLGSKVKRRPIAQTDEDEDVEFGLDVNAQAVVDVSQSLVRPPKPKSAKQSRPPSVATTRIAAQKTGRRGGRFRDRRQQEAAPERPEIITLTGDLTVQELAARLVLPESEVIKILFFKGIAATINQMLDLDTATMVVKELGLEIETAQAESAAKKVTEMLAVDDLENLQRRPPVVTIMGHVDHGKTTLLDAIRKTKVAQGEAGGITQHIGAYHVDVEHDGKMQQVVFLDTPGHEAFTAMRARGARVTDVAILVVAADDGVRPQTIEAISHAKAAEVPIIVAINKVDKESAQPDRVKQELTEYALVPEEWGGDTIMVPVSAIQGENLDTLLEMILLVTEVEDLYANPDRLARGTVIEANLDKARGAVATLLVQNGTLRVGDILVAGSAMGKVRAMIDDRGQRVAVASPSFAVEVLGLGDVPAAGDEFEVFSDEKEARAIATARLDEQRLSRLQQAMSSRRVSLTALSDQAREGELKELNLILKADVQGSVEAILGALGQLPKNEVQVRVLYSAPGEISETDVDLAAASDAVIIGFNTTLATGARQAADREGVDIRDYNIIYKLLDDIQGAMEGLLEPELIEEPLGQAEVRAVFPVGKGAVAGCYVQSGKLIRNCKVRVLRGDKVIHSGTLNSLKRIKEDAREVNSGYECGIRLDDFQTWEESDIIEAFQMVTKRRSLSPA
ncbi:MAG: translation initiation factor IF-2 [Aphanocapsa sp. GSE-SYN-MK-11-07L]|jgi:translation initiation factor IF-2|nr:translation initiation factor IF-2 [Aphanocapsa sp. GSE-SYN-MK-11-07L]